MDIVNRVGGVPKTGAGDRIACCHKKNDAENGAVFMIHEVRWY